MTQDNFDSLVKNAFENHGVSNPELEKAISEILNSALDSRNLSRRIYKDIKERIDRDEKTRNAFK